MKWFSPRNARKRGVKKHMDLIETVGGRALNGCVRVQGAKNSVLPILAATVLTNGVSVIENCPSLRDVDATVAILEEIGCRVTRENTTLAVDSECASEYNISPEHMSSLRSSVVFLGALLARQGRAELFMPGGCELGARPIDIHLWALMRMGAKITNRDGCLTGTVVNPVGCELVLPIPSVGATENIMLFATACTGTTTIVNAAREPEIADLQAYLTAAGFEVSGAGTPVVRITGRRTARLSGRVSHRVMPDRIAAATWMCAAAAAGGEVMVEGVEHEPLARLSALLTEMGCTVFQQGGAVTVRRTGPLIALLQPVRTGPYPSFPTDMQPLLTVPASVAEGCTAFEENMFDDRYRHIPELNRMGAQIALSGKYALCTGVRRLHGATVRACDLRGGAALVLAGLCAEGQTVIANTAYIDRGYERIEETLAQLGADIRRIRA